MLETTFHEAIRGGDVAARLIYADWLEEQGRLVECSMLRSSRWCLVPAGNFWMGGSGGKPGEKQVVIPKAFYLGACPVTQKEWHEVMGYNPSYFSRHGQGSAQVESISDKDLVEFPVEQISIDNINIYIRQRNELEKGSNWVYRLPMGAEWEYACRGAATTPEECSFDYYLDQPSNKLFSWLANFNGIYPAGSSLEGPSLQRTTGVDSYLPNRLGLFHMHGNVWELCQDPAEELKPVYWMDVRYAKCGGSWSNVGNNCRTAVCVVDTRPSNNYGFRLARVMVS